MKRFFFFFQKGREVMENLVNLEKNLSLGKFLTQARLDNNLSVNDLSLITKIHKTLLHSLENDEIENLPNRIYILGFLKSLSGVLRCDFQKCVYLYEQNLSKIIESHRPVEIVLEEAPEKVVPISIFTRTRLIKVKWLLASFIAFVCVLIISPLFIQSNDNQSNKEDTSQKLTLTKFVKDKSNKEIVMPRPILKSSSFNVSIIASQGISWISFQVDKNPIRKITLKKGSSIILKGESIRLVLGNYTALEIKNNKEAVSFKKNIIGDVAKINFPQVENDFSPAQKLIFTLENNGIDQTQRL